MRFPWSKKKGYDIECERFIKYNGTKVDLSALDIGPLKLGGLGVEQTALQAASQALMLLDFSQYQLCQAIKSAPSDEERKKAFNLRMHDISRLQGIVNAIAGLSLNPESAPLQNTLRELLLSSVAASGERAIMVESSSSIQPDENVKEENSIEVGSAPLKSKIENLKQSYPEMKAEILQPDEEKEGKSEITWLIDKYNELLEGFNQASDNNKIAEYYKSTFAPIIRDIIEKQQEPVDIINEIGNRLDNLSGEIGQLKELKGTSTKEEQDKGTIIKMRMRRIMDNVKYASLAVN